MRLYEWLLPLFCTVLAVGEARTAPNSNKAVLLSNIQSLTLHAGKKTTHRRVSAIPQLRCVGGNAKGKYDVDIVRCTNQGSSYSSADVEWSCTASLPPEFKLGSTDVICEGYRDSEDEWVLKGSCGVEYRLILTELGEKKYKKSGWNLGSNGAGSGDYSYGQEHIPTKADNIVASLFWLVFVGVVIWMIYSFYTQRQQGRRGGTVGGRRPGGGGGGGGGGWFPGNENDDPPPPYSPHQPPRKSYSSGQSRGWRPGFWTGAGTGAAAGYAAGRYSNRNTGPSSYGSGRGGSSWDRGEGSSSDSGNFSSSRYSSTGFGSTSRR